MLHVGPDACSTVSRLLREEQADAWGVEPYDIEDVDRSCKRMVHRGIVRMADIRFLLPYRAKSFSLVIVSDALDYLSPKYLNRTIPELARVSSDGLVIFTGNTNIPHSFSPFFYMILISLLVFVALVSHVLSSISVVYFLSHLYSKDL